MAKWGLWTAHRYVWAGAAVTRKVGADGRLLKRAWRTRSENAVTEANRIRARRPQGIWPRVLGWGCIGVALVTAINPMTWVQPTVEVSAYSGLAPESPGRSIAISSPQYDPSSAGFHWPAGEVSGPYRLVILAEDYLPIAEFDGIEGSTFCPDPESLEALSKGERYAAYLLATHEERAVKSPLISFVWE